MWLLWGRGLKFMLMRLPFIQEGMGSHSSGDLAGQLTLQLIMSQCISRSSQWLVAVLFSLKMWCLPSGIGKSRRDLRRERRDPKAWN